jgi:hypothetical protein
MPGSDPDAAMLQRAKTRAFEQLTELGRLLDAERPREATAAAQRLLELFVEQGDGEALAGFGTMVLDAAFWLVARGRDDDALRLCCDLIARLDGGTDSERAVAAGARFLAAQAAGRIGDLDASRHQLEALCAMGEPALAALDRLAGRLVSAGADPAWHAQLAAATVTVLWRMRRSAEARTLAAEAAASFARLGQPRLATMLSELEREVAAG